MNNTAIIKIHNSDASNIACINTEHCQIMRTIADRIMKFESIIKKTIFSSHAFFAFVTFNNMNSITYINSIVIQHL